MSAGGEFDAYDTDGTGGGPVIRDKRRIDPESGLPRVTVEQEPGEAPAPAAPSPSAEEVAALQAQLAERTADLQRVQAEYANYRRRVERDRESVRELALVNVLSNLLPVLDDLDRARQHGELEGGFKAVGEALEAVVGKLGLERYGAPGEPFDPTVHEALTHAYAPDVEGPTAVAILQPGYRMGLRIVRPARVAVAEPES